MALIIPLSFSESYSIVDYKKESDLPERTYIFRILYGKDKSPLSISGMTKEDGEDCPFVIKDKGKLEKIVNFVKNELKKE